LSPLGAGLSASLYGQDDAGEHSYALTLGYDSTLHGQLAGFYPNFAYGYHANVDPASVASHPFGIRLYAGWWPHDTHLKATTETALGLRGQLSATVPLDRWVSYAQLELGLVHLQSFGSWQPDARLDAILSQRRSDSWGYVARGARFGMTARWSAGSEGGRFGSWADASYYNPLSSFGLAGTGEFALRTGYRQAPPVPLALKDWAAVGTLGYRYSLPIVWRYADGLVATERLTLEPRLRGWFDGSLAIGTDLGLNLDTVFIYSVPVSFGFTLGYAQAFWYSFGLRLTL
jgi:hypothetical protein